MKLYTCACGALETNPNKVFGLCSGLGHTRKYEVVK